MNILTRNVPRQYLRNGNLNLTGEGYSSFSYGLSGMTGGYLPALPLEEGGYLVEDPVTFMQNILIQGDTKIEGNTQIDGNLNIDGKFTINGEEFTGGGEAYLKDLKDVGYTEEPETPTNDTLLVYSSTYESWLYKNGKTYVEDIIENSSTITNIQIQIDGIKRRLQALEDAEYITFYPKRPGANYSSLDKYGNPIYNTHIVMPLAVLAYGAWGSQPDDDINSHDGTAWGEIEILDRKGLHKCYITIPFSYGVCDANMSGHHYMGTRMGGIQVIGGHYNWSILSKKLFTSNYITAGDQYAIAFESDTIIRVRAKILYHFGPDVGFGEPEIVDKTNKIQDIYSTAFNKENEDIKNKFKYSPEFIYTYSPSFLSNYNGDANIYGNTLLKSGNDIINNHYMVYGGASGIAQQYGIRLESSGEGYSNQMLSYINVSGYYGVDMYGWGLNIEVANGYKLTTDYHDGFLINGAKILTQNDIYPKKDIYTKEEVNTILQNYYSINSVYTKTEVNELLDNLEIDKYYKKEESDERYYTKEETESISEELVKENYDYYFKPVIQRVTNIESQLGDIEILLDKILGYEANEYLNETLDEIIG